MRFIVFLLVAANLAALYLTWQHSISFSTHTVSEDPPAVLPPQPSPRLVLLSEMSPQEPQEKTLPARLQTVYAGGNYSGSNPLGSDQLKGQCFVLGPVVL